MKIKEIFSKDPWKYVYYLLLVATVEIILSFKIIYNFVFNSEVYILILSTALLIIIGDFVSKFIIGILRSKKPEYLNRSTHNKIRYLILSLLFYAINVFAINVFNLDMKNIIVEVLVFAAVISILDQIIEYFLEKLK
jgi:hypothetical protein